MLRILFFLFCLAGVTTVTAQPQPPATSASLQDFQRDVAQMIELRSRAYRFARDHGVASKGTPALTRAEGNQIRDLGHDYLRLRGSLLPRAQAVADLFAGGSRLVLHDDYATGEPIEEAVLSDGREKALQRHWLNPGDAAGRAQMRDIMFGLAAALVLMDSYQIAVEPYAANPTLGWLLTYDVDSHQSLRRLQANYHSADYRRRMLLATRLVDQYMERKRKTGQLAEGDEEYLYGLIQSTVWYVQLRRHGTGGLGNTLHYLAQRFETRQRSVRARLSHGLSLGFGNMIGLVETRHGKLHALAGDQRSALERELKPLDILLEKTPFRLTDKMIPGHYGHVAIWLGSEAELRELGIWERIPAHWQQQIQGGARIVEALRSGVTLSPLDRFLNIDDLLVLRDRRAMPADYRQKALLTAVEQLGKEYDFNFDVLTHKRIVCSELAYVVFPDVRWPLDKTLGRYTISPDNVARLAVGSNATFAPALLYHDGTRINDALDQALSRLLQNGTLMAQN